MMRVVSIGLLVAVTLTGCVAPDGSQKSNSSLKTMVNSPSWVLNPEKAGFISVVGAAPLQDWGGREAQYRVALKKAHQELGQMIRVQVQSSSHFKAEMSKAGVVQEADVESRLLTNVGLQLNAARIVEEWTDPQSGMLYLWLVTPSQ